MSGLVKATVKNKVGYVELNRPNVFNALSTQLMLDLKSILTEMDKNDEAHCIVLCGAGDAFCTGADIKEFSNQTNNEEAIEFRANLTKDVHLLIPSITKPVIASVHGYTLAGGCGIALACDLVIAADNTIFSYPEIKRGFVPAIVTPNLSRITNRKQAFEMLITGSKVSASEALQKGFINKVVPLTHLKEETSGYAEIIAGYSLNALSMTKSLFYTTIDHTFSEAIEIAKASNIKMRKSDDFKKGVKEFVNRK